VGVAEGAPVRAAEARARVPRCPSEARQTPAVEGEVSDEAALRRVVIFAQVKKDFAASLKASEEAFDDARTCEAQGKALAVKVEEHRHAVKRGEYKSATMEAEARENLAALKARGVEARKHATRRKREASLAAALLELRAMEQENAVRIAAIMARLGMEDT
jgi:hypothetical protein